MESLAVVVSLMFLTAITFPIIAIVLYLFNRHKGFSLVLVFQVIFTILGFISSGFWVYSAPFPVRLFGLAGVVALCYISFTTFLNSKKD